MATSYPNSTADWTYPEEPNNKFRGAWKKLQWIIFKKWTRWQRMVFLFVTAAAIVSVIECIVKWLWVARLASYKC